MICIFEQVLYKYTFVNQHAHLWVQEGRCPTCRPMHKMILLHKLAVTGVRDIRSYSQTIYIYIYKYIAISTEIIIKRIGK